jgi:thiol-disulfide isomerase/thioredoxin
MLKRVVPALVGIVLLAVVVIWFVFPRPVSWLLEGTTDPTMPPISGTVAKFTLTNPGRPAPIEPFFDADGNEVSLHQFGDRVVLLNLWATWCAPCIEELPSLDRLQAQLGGDRFQVVAVSVDRRGAEAVRPFFEKLGIAHLPIYVEPKNQLAQALGVQVLPSTIVIAPHGLMVGNIIGTVEWDAPEAQDLLRFYIDRSAPDG